MDFANLLLNLLLGIAGLCMLCGILMLAYIFIAAISDLRAARRKPADNICTDHGLDGCPTCGRSESEGAE